MWFKKLTKNSAEIVPENMEDILFLRIYLSEGDLVASKTFRTIKYEKMFSLRVEKERKSVILTVKVENVRFAGSFEILNIDGEIQASSDPNIPQGSRHVLEIRPGTRILLIKEDEIKFDLLSGYIKQDQFLILSLDSIVAGIGEVKGSRIDYVTEIPSYYQGKRYETRQELKQEFFEKISKVLGPLLKQNKKIVISGPGALKLEFKNYLENTNQGKALQTYIVEGVDTAGFDGIRMALNSEGFSKVMQDSFFSKAKNVMEKILQSMYKGDGLSSSSIDEIKIMASNGACDSLLILKDYLSKYPVDEEILVEIFSNLVRYKGSLFFLDNKTNVGIQLDSIGGVAALYRYRVR
ncbi:MAG: hypothetical protein QXJ17_04050 [Nitrososphaeria archaeon]